MYGFRFADVTQILHNGMLPKGDPKIAFAKNFIDSPVDVNEAPYEDLIKIPGVGPVNARRIVGLQEKGGDITRKELQNMGVALNRAMPFIKIQGMRQKMLTAY